MLTIYIKENYNVFFNSNKNKFYLLIYYIKTILILCLTNIYVLTNILIAKKNKILSTILYYVYNTSILSLYIANSFLNKFIFVNNKN